MKPKHQTLTGFMALAVFGLLAVCLLLVLLSGANVYRRLTLDGQSRHQSRTAAQYITTRIRQSEDIRVEDFGGVDALVFPETLAGRVYLTRVYCHGGYLRELFTPENGEFSPEDGEKLVEAESLSLSLEGDALTVVICLKDKEQRLLFALEEGGAP